MNSSDAEAGKAKRVRQILYWGAATVLAAWALWKIGDPWLIEHFDSGAPWWAYVLLSMRLAGGCVQMVVADAGLRKKAGEEAAGEAAALHAEIPQCGAGPDFSLARQPPPREVNSAALYR